jgi:hypothetical protein
MLPFDKDSSIAWADALKLNSLTTLSLQQMRSLGDEEVKQISKGLVLNTTLKNLYLFNNEIGDAGIKAICKTLKKNTALTSLDISQNINLLSVEGYRSLNNLLDFNCTITAITLFASDTVKTSTLAREENKLQIEKLQKRLLCNANEGIQWKTDEEITYCTWDNTPKDIIILILSAYHHVRI